MRPWRANKLQIFSAIFTVRKIDQLGSGWGLVVSADFNSVGSNPSIGAVGSTPSRSRRLYAYSSVKNALRRFWNYFVEYSQS